MVSRINLESVMKLRIALLSACLGLPLAAHAQPVTGPYVSLEGGVSIENPVDVNLAIGGQSASGKILYRPNYVGIGGVGFGFGNGFRVELDGDYFHNTAAKLDIDNDGGSTKLGRYENKYGGTVNLLYDISVGLPVYPYVGAGVGYQYTNAKYNTPNDLGTASGAEGSFAYDAIAGLSYPIDSVPGLSVTAEYRFTALTEKYKYGFSVLGGFPPGSPTPGTAKLGPETSHSFLLGLRYVLFPAPMMAPPPATAPMAAAPAPVPARTYLVFFDWDKSKLTPRATQIIAQAASDSKSAATTTLDVSGYTDTSGTPVYNQGLSERRAKAVAAQLVADGVPASEIAIHAYGETHLLVPTGPGVREPQNRRVEIVLQ
jgi:opacity protein-like surface antigen